MQLVNNTYWSYLRKKGNCFLSFVESQNRLVLGLGMERAVTGFMCERESEKCFYEEIGAFSTTSSKRAGVYTL